MLRSVALTLLCSFAALAEAPAVRVELSSMLVERDHKTQREVLKPPQAVRPGDVMLWTAKVINSSKADAQSVRLTIPVPKQTKYLAGTASILVLNSVKVIPQFSFDGGQHFATEPLKKRVLVYEGNRQVEKEVVVSPSEYTHIQWILPKLAAQSQVEATVRTQVR